MVPEEPEAAASPEPTADAGAEPSTTTEVVMSEAGSDNASPDAGAVEAPVDTVAGAEGEETEAVDEASGAAEAGDDAPAKEEMIAEAAPEAETEDSNEDTSIMALTEEQPPEDDPVMRAALFETATPLPDIDTLRPLPPFRRNAAGPLVVQFQLNEAGKITVLERVTVTTVTQSETTEGEETSEEAEAPRVDNDHAVDRLLRKMRRTRFRPRYEEGVAVETGMIVWSFDLNPASAEAIALQP
tara:strand:- start:503 stop:1228 length:726 start_codon:yes stop_codon:yes gene_type:complete